jgi:transcription-repair coupling factor (superfamily II helicase)
MAVSIAEKFGSLKRPQQLAEMIFSSRKGDQIRISTLSGSSKILFIRKLAPELNEIIILLPGLKEAEEFFVEADILGLSKTILLINDFRPELLQEKITEISKRDKLIIISTYELLNHRFPSKERLERDTTLVTAGGDIRYEDMIDYFNLLNYQKDKYVGAPGEYSVRGSIIDFWSYSEKNPVRLEYDGDFLESIRYFDAESQRSTEAVESVSLAAQISADETPEEFVSIFEFMKEPYIFVSEYELNSFASTSRNIFSEVKKENETTEVNKEIEYAEDEFPEPEEIEEIESDTPPGNGSEFKFNPGAVWIIEEELNRDHRFETGFRQPPVINGNYEVLFNVLREFSEKTFSVVITVENELQLNRLRDLLSNYKEELSYLVEDFKIRLESIAIKEGFLNDEEKLLVLTDYQIFNKPYRTKLPSSRKYRKAKSKEFASIKKGDYVVHEDYGIGKYLGLETIKIGQTDQESMKIQYNEGGLVYVNLNYLALVKKYSSNENLVPTLSTLGTNEWINTKQKTKKKIKEAARELIELYAKRKAARGYPFSEDSVWQKELEASFFYEDTPDQEKVTQEVKEDMQAVHPMDRLVCGDVGFGKTEIAVRAAFKAVQDGKQASVLVPTTILAEQHLNTFKDRLSQFPVKIAALSRFQSKKEQTEIVNQLEEGKVDIVIGTHRLLSKDIKFKDLGLLIIDEEHRFGVSAKERLKSIKVNVDTLTLTATPIPRTLNLSLLGARDLSIIATPPPNRQPIYTHVSTFDIFRIKDWILNELKRNGQVYVVHDRVHSIDKLAAYMRKYIPDIKIGIAHGQMKPSQLEDVIHKFINRDFDVLLSTKIIESGIDIPNVNTIIVNRADRFGLAELHQLRGRVGRSTRQAYAYFIVPSISVINKKALRRLQALEEYTDVGSGFNISMRDLEIRGAGNLLGTEQSGFINDVGFDLYIKLINQAVEELKYQEFKEVFRELPKPESRTEPTLDTYFEIGINDTYMPDQMDRLNFYTALYAVKELSELQELRDEMIDRFGPIPITTIRLIAAAELRYYASHALFERIIIQRNNIFIILPRGENEDYYKFRFVEMMRFIVDKYGDKVKFSQQKEVLKLIIQNNFEDPERTLTFLLRFSREISELQVTEETPVQD